MTTRRSLLVNGVLCLAAGATTAAASLPLGVPPSGGPDCIDAQAVRGQPGYDPDILAYRWSIYLDERLLPMDGSGGFYVKGADQRAGYVDVYLLDTAGYPVGNGDITRRYGRVRIYKGERD
jgi:hypothetical protein